MPDNLPCTAWRHAAFNCVIMSCLLSLSALILFLVHMCSRTQSHVTNVRTGWKTEVGGKGTSQGGGV